MRRAAIDCALTVLAFTGTGLVCARQRAATSDGISPPARPTSRSTIQEWPSTVLVGARNILVVVNQPHVAAPEFVMSGNSG